jgi:hypothetical protein
VLAGISRPDVASPREPVPISSTASSMSGDQADEDHADGGVAAAGLSQDALAHLVSPLPPSLVLVYLRRRC